MTDESYPVTVNVYDISNGMAAALSEQMLGKKIDGIWHTGIIVYGKEFYFGGGICKDPIGQTPYGTPVKNEAIGSTEIPEEMFLDYLNELSSKYTESNYDLLTNNCNHFTGDAVEFLTGTPLPVYISGLIDEIRQAPMGGMILNMVSGMTSQVQANSHTIFNPSTAEGQANLARTFGGQNPDGNGQQGNPPK
jgi:hypothetical protein